MKKLFFTFLLVLFGLVCFSTSIITKAYGVGDIKLYDFGGGTPTIRFYNRDTQDGINIQPFLTYVNDFTDYDIGKSSFGISSFGVQGIDVDIITESIFEIREITNKVQYLQHYDIYEIYCDATIQNAQYGSWDTIQVEWNNVLINPDVLSSYLLENTSYDNLMSTLYFFNDAMAYWDITFRVQNSYGGYEYVNLTTQDEGISGQVSILPTSYQNSFSINELNEFDEMYAGVNQYIYIEKAICEITSIQGYIEELSYSQIVTDYNVVNEVSQYQVWYNYDNLGNFGDIGESITDSVSNFLKIEILPNFSLLNLLLIVLAIPLLIYILKLFLGG